MTKNRGKLLHFAINNYAAQLYKPQKNRIDIPPGHQQKTSGATPKVQSGKIFNKVITLYRKALAASAGTGCIGVFKLEAFPVQSVRVIQFRINQVKKTFQVRYHANTF